MTTRPFRTLLVPHDFSEHAAAALSLALEWAQAFGARIHLVHVHHRPMEVYAPETFPLAESVLPELRRGVALRLEQEFEKVRASGVAGEWHTREGPPADQIVEVAREIGADLVVMGTRGLSGLKHVLLGSVAERTLRLAPCPVLTVKTAASAEEAGGPHGANPSPTDRSPR